MIGPFILSALLFLTKAAVIVFLGYHAVVWLFRGFVVALLAEGINEQSAVGVLIMIATLVAFIGLSALLWSVHF